MHIFNGKQQEAICIIRTRNPDDPKASMSPWLWVVEQQEQPAPAGGETEPPEAMHVPGNGRVHTQPAGTMHVDSQEMHFARLEQQRCHFVSE